MDRRHFWVLTDKYQKEVVFAWKSLKITGEGFVSKPSYSSLRRVKLSPKYSSLVNDGKVKNKASILHSSWSGENFFAEAGRKVKNRKRIIENVLLTPPNRRFNARMGEMCTFGKWGK